METDWIKLILVILLVLTVFFAYKCYTYIDIINQKDKLLLANTPGRRTNNNEVVVYPSENKKPTDKLPIKSTINNDIFKTQMPKPQLFKPHCLNNVCKPRVITEIKNSSNKYNKSESESESETETETESESETESDIDNIENYNNNNTIIEKYDNDVIIPININNLIQKVFDDINTNQTNMSENISFINVLPLNKVEQNNIEINSIKESDTDSKSSIDSQKNKVVTSPSEELTLITKELEPIEEVDIQPDIIVEDLENIENKKIDNNLDNIGKIDKKSIIELRDLAKNIGIKLSINGKQKNKDILIKEIKEINEKK